VPLVGITQPGTNTPPLLASRQVQSLCFLNGALTTLLGAFGKIDSVLGITHVRSSLCSLHNFHLCPRGCLPEGLRAPEVKVTSMLGNIILIAVAVLLCGYLLYALLKPENF
jgi:K+-transporting ATPase KdpF subunit